MPILQGLTYTGVSTSDENLAQLNGEGKTYVGYKYPSGNVGMFESPIGICRSLNAGFP